MSRPPKIVGTITAYRAYNEPGPIWMNRSETLMSSECAYPELKVRHYGHRDVVLSVTRYLRNNRICLRLMSTGPSGALEPCAVCTVNLAHIPMRDDEVAIKTWHENIGMLDWLVDQGLVSMPLRYAFFANTFIPICSLLPQQNQAALRN